MIFPVTFRPSPPRRPANPAVVLTLTLPSGFLLFAGCAHHPAARVAVHPNVVATSYDYTRPGDVAKKNKPVWILPKTSVGWVKGGVDRRSGDWHSGEYVGTIVEPGHWATLEEAELGGQPFIVAGESRTAFPEPARNQGASATELNATTLLQRLRSLESQVGGDRRSRPLGSVDRRPAGGSDFLSNRSSLTSLDNQAALGSGQAKAPPRAEPAGPPPTLKVPGLNAPAGRGTARPADEGGDSRREPAEKPSVSAGPDEIPPPPPPVPAVGSTPGLPWLPSGREAADRVRSPATGADAPLGPTELPRHLSTQGELCLGPRAPGTRLRLLTGRGEIRVSYLSGGEVEVVRGDQAFRITCRHPRDVIRLRLDAPALARR